MQLMCTTKELSCTPYILIPLLWLQDKPRSVAEIGTGWAAFHPLLHHLESAWNQFPCSFLGHGQQATIAAHQEEEFKHPKDETMPQGDLPRFITHRAFSMAVLIS